MIYIIVKMWRVLTKKGAKDDLCSDAHKTLSLSKVSDN